MQDLFRQKHLIGKVSGYAYPKAEGKTNLESIGFFLFLEKSEIECLLWDHQIRELSTWTFSHKERNEETPAVIELNYKEIFGSSSLIIARIFSVYPDFEYILLIESIGIGFSTALFSVTISEESMLAFVEHLELFLKES